MKYCWLQNCADDHDIKDFQIQTFFEKEKKKSDDAIQ